MRLTQRGTYARLLVAILLTLMVLPLLTHHLGPRRWLTLTFFLVMLAAALEATQAERRTRVFVWVAGLVAILTSSLAFAAGEARGDGGPRTLDTVLGVLNHGSSVVFLGMVVMLLIRRALAPGRVTGERITASICAYLLLGLLWSEGYQVLAEFYVHSDGPILALPALADGTVPAATYQDYTYFSFVTLTTLGYGDILPVHPGARALAYLESVTGVLYLATLVARLVALHIAHEHTIGDQDDSGVS